MKPGERIRAWRKLRGMTQGAVVAPIRGLRVETLSKMERGLQRIPTETIEKIAASMGLTMPQFYGEVAEAESEPEAA